MFCSYLKVGCMMLSCIPCSQGISCNHSGPCDVETATFINETPAQDGCIPCAKTDNTTSKFVFNVFLDNIVVATRKQTSLKVISTHVTADLMHASVHAVSTRYLSVVTRTFLVSTRKFLVRTRNFFFFFFFLFFFIFLHVPLGAP